jgi:hypothetical protein
MSSFDVLLHDIWEPEFKLAAQFWGIFIVGLVVAIAIAFLMYIKRKQFIYKPGIKAGLLASLLVFAAHMIFNISLSSPLIGYQFLAFIFLNVLPVVIIPGIFLGAAFVFFYDKLPGTSDIKKAFVLGSIPLILLVIIALITFDSYKTNIVTDIIDSVIGYVVFGIFLGYFYDRFKKSQQKPVSK